MVQIEELGKVIARIISRRKAADTRKNPELVQVVYNSLETDRPFLLEAPVNEILGFLNGKDMAGLLRMEIAARLLMEESFLAPERQLDLRMKAREMLMYIQQHDTTFSLERLYLLNELEHLISE